MKVARSMDLIMVSPLLRSTAPRSHAAAHSRRPRRAVLVALVTAAAGRRVPVQLLVIRLRRAGAGSTRAQAAGIARRRLQASRAAVALFASAGRATARDIAGRRIELLPREAVARP